jgi:hypothetical protein
MAEERPGFWETLIIVQYLSDFPGTLVKLERPQVVD